jgi:ABC-type methionine transport system permease subunit
LSKDTEISSSKMFPFKPGCILYSYMVYTVKNTLFEYNVKDKILSILINMYKWVIFDILMALTTVIRTCALYIRKLHEESQIQ